MDTLTPEQRSTLMSRIRSRDTKPEMLVRRLVYSCGYRYHVHCSDLPGTPDLVFRARKKIIFVHGCFWHAHPHCHNNRMPKSRTEFWIPKLQRNRKRDVVNLRNLRRRGWQVEVVWECQTKDLEVLRSRLVRFLGEQR
jgi:DNA mismatch endonuclease (patch repair protein)